MASTTLPTITPSPINFTIRPLQAMTAGSKSFLDAAFFRHKHARLVGGD
jgi:hypothetical protein